MTSPNGNKVPNQFIIRNEIWNGMYKEYFQSYDSVIACIVYGYNQHREEEGTIYLDEKYWNYSTTTKKYLNLFLNMSNEVVNKMVKHNRFKFTNLNDNKVH